MTLVIGLVARTPQVAEEFYLALAERMSEQAHILAQGRFEDQVMLLPVADDVPPTELRPRDEI